MKFVFHHNQQAKEESAMRSF